MSSLNSEGEEDIPGPITYERVERNYRNLNRRPLEIIHPIPCGHTQQTVPGVTGRESVGGQYPIVIQPAPPSLFLSRPSQNPKSDSQKPTIIRQGPNPSVENQLHLAEYRRRIRGKDEHKIYPIGPTREVEYFPRNIRVIESSDSGNEAISVEPSNDNGEGPSNSRRVITHRDTEGHKVNMSKRKTKNEKHKTAPHGSHTPLIFLVITAYNYRAFLTNNSGPHSRLSTYSRHSTLVLSTLALSTLDTHL